jgi:large subunit ribosomal protein L10
VKQDEKQKLIHELAENFAHADTAYLMDYSHMTVAQAVALRKLLRKNSYPVKVVKNRLALRALQGDVPEPLRGYFQKPTVVAFAAEEPIRLARLLRDFAAQNKVLTFKGGVIEGQLLPPERFEEVCRLTSKKELLGKIGYLMASPLMQLLRTWQAPVSSLGRLLSQLKEKK